MRYGFTFVNNEKYFRVGRLGRLEMPCVFDDFIQPPQMGSFISFKEITEYKSCK